MGKSKNTAFLQGERDAIGPIVRLFLEDESPLVRDLAHELLEYLDSRCAAGVDVIQGVGRVEATKDAPQVTEESSILFTVPKGRA